MLVANPWSLFDVGFQLSFLSMLAILVVGPLLYGLLSARWLQRHPFVRALWGLSVVSVAAQIGVAPLVAYYFCRFSTYFLLTNFIVIPAATLILYLSLASLVIPQIAWLLAITVGALNAAVTMVSELPFASISDRHPTALQTVAAYVLAAALVGITALWSPLRRIKAWNK
jgi:competence protein ComEC